KQGQAFFQLGDFDHALAEYQLALDLSAEPSLIFNIALCHDRANRPEQALEAYRHYLEVAPEGPVSDEAREDIARLVPIVEKLHADQAAEAHQREEAARRADLAARPKPPERPSRVPVYLVAAGGVTVVAGAAFHILGWRTRDRLDHAPHTEAYYADPAKLRPEPPVAVGAAVAPAAPAPPRPTPP